MWLHFSPVWKRRTPRNEQWLDRWHKPILYWAGWWHLYQWTKEDRVPYPGGAWAERPPGSTVSPWVFTCQHPWVKASSHARRKTQSSPSLCGWIQLACQGIFERWTKHQIFSLALFLKELWQFQKFLIYMFKFIILNHPCSSMVYYYLFGVFLSK